MPDSQHDLWPEQTAVRSLATACPTATKDVAPNLALPWVLQPLAEGIDIAIAPAEHGVVAI
jgi:hypothetical protein